MPPEKKRQISSDALSVPDIQPIPNCREITISSHILCAATKTKNGKPIGGKNTCHGSQPRLVAVNEVRVHLTLMCSMDDDREDARPLSLNGGAAVTSRIEKDGAGWEVGCHL